MYAAWSNIHILKSSVKVGNVTTWRYKLFKCVLCMCLIPTRGDLSFTQCISCLYLIHLNLFWLTVLAGRRQECTQISKFTVKYCKIFQEMLIFSWTPSRNYTMTLNLAPFPSVWLGWMGFKEITSSIDVIVRVQLPLSLLYISHVFMFMCVCETLKK